VQRGRRLDLQRAETRSVFEQQINLMPTGIYLLTNLSRMIGLTEFDPWRRARGFLESVGRMSARLR